MSDHNECALDLQAGLNEMGWPSDMPTGRRILDNGGTVLMPCPACEMAGRLHTLEVRQVDRKFIVMTADR